MRSLINSTNDSPSTNDSRRNFLKKGSLLGLAGIIHPASMITQLKDPAKDTPKGPAEKDLSTKKQPMTTQVESKWADGSRLVVSVSMQFEAGGQPDNAESPFPQNMKKGFPDLPSATWYAYGYKEGIPRMLDNWDKWGIKVTSHMVGSAVLKNPGLAREIVQRGHEAAAHGMDWRNQYDLPYEEEKKFIKDGADAVQKITGSRSVGYNANWLRRGENTLGILQELGFIYHIDDLSRDEPYIIQVNKKDFVIVPYTLRCNDILLIEGRHFSTDQFLNQVKMEFDQLYAEAEFKRRQLSISFHDRIGGTPQMVRATSELFAYMQKQKGVVFKRKDDIAKMALADRTTIRE